MDITRIFYEEIVPEAAIGKINVYFSFSEAFSTYLVELNKHYECVVDTPGVLIPTLTIKNKELFDSLLTEYVIKAIDFYDDENIYDEVLNYKNSNREKVGKIKLIMTQLFANATVEDFNDPVNFLRRRIDFINNHTNNNINLGYSELLGANLELITLKDTLNNEATGEFVIRATDNDDKWISPRLKYGISNDQVYIYAIQNEDVNNGPLTKKINRKLYKVGEGFTDLKEEENPKDITASFLVTLNMAISYFMSLGYDKFVIPSILVVRYNAKKIIIENKFKKKKIDTFMKEDLNSELDDIQSNLTNKLIRTFLRLGCHYNNINVDSLPYELDSSLHISLNNQIEMMCNNKLLLETYLMVKNGSSLTK